MLIFLHIAILTSCVNKVDLTSSSLRMPQHRLPLPSHSLNMELQSNTTDNRLGDQASRCSSGHETRDIGQRLVLTLLAFCLNPVITEKQQSRSSVLREFSLTQECKKASGDFVNPQHDKRLSCRSARNAIDDMTM
jgi:hypothetical protein